MRMVAPKAVPPQIRLLFGTMFGLYYMGNGLSLMGSWMQRIACSWLVWEWTHSAFWVGVVAAADLLPVVAISPFAGVAADRLDRRKLNIVIQSFAVANAAALSILLATGHLGLFGVVAMTAIQGSVTAITQPSRLAMVQQMVSRADIGTAVGMNSANVNLARLVGPAVAGVIILHGGTHWVFALNALFTLFFVLVLFRLRLTPMAPRQIGTSVLTEMKQGFAFVLTHPALRLILLTMFVGGALVRATIELLPAVAARGFGGDVTGLATLTGAAAIGAVISGMTVRRSASSRLFLSVLPCWAFGAITSTILASTTSALVAIGAAAFLGASITRAQVCTQTFVQLSAPDELRGRALSIHGLMARGSPAIGALITGYTSDRFGLDLAVSGSAALLLVFLLCMTLPMRRAARTQNWTGQ